MHRKWLAAGAVLCLLIMIALGYEWIASYNNVLVRAAQGKLYLIYTPVPENMVVLSAPDKPMSIFIRDGRSVIGMATSHSWNRLGVEYLDAEWFTAFGVSFAYLIPLPLIASIVLVHRLRRDARRRRLGLCRQCGYDLREPGDRCPECGAQRTIQPAA
jgi:hypothetical protein